MALRTRPKRSPLKIGSLTFRPTRRGWIILALAALLASSYAADAVASIGSVRSGVRAGSLELGGMSREAAQEALTEHAQLLVSNPVELFADDLRVSVSPSEIGYQPDVEATLEDAMGVGRRGNLLVRTWHRFRALFASTDVGWTSRHDAEAAQLLLSDLASRIDTEGHEAGIEAAPGGVELVPVAAVPGRRLDQAEAIPTIIRAFEAWPRRPMELPISTEQRRTTIDDARRAAEVANGWTRAPVTLAAEERRRVLSRQELAGLIEAVPRRSGNGWALQPRFSPDRVGALLGEEMRTFEREPRNASWATDGARATLRAGENGRTFDPTATSQALGEAAGREQNRLAQAAFAEVEPGLTTEAAQALRITELVSSFTTHFPCCQPRVSNIHKMADAVDGALVRPGASFSLNNHVGQRTTEKGYLLAPMIFDGEFRDDVGGGVSQFATTMFNAIFFGGYKFDTYKAHSYYISRYPEGREATISWPRPDLAFTNDSSSGILIKTAYSGTSITVSFYGDKEGKVVSAEKGERTNFTEPAQQRRLNPDMAPGSERVVQSAAQGFDVRVTRIIRKDGDETRQTFSTRYRAQPEIVEHGPEIEATPTPEGEEDPSPTPSPDPEASPAA